MVVKSSTFGAIQLSGQDAARFARHMGEDKPNARAQAALARGRKILQVAPPSAGLPQPQYVKNILEFFRRHSALTSVTSEEDVQYLHLALDRGHVSARLAAKSLGATLDELKTFFTARAMPAPFDL